MSREASWPGWIRWTPRCRGIERIIWLGLIDLRRLYTILDSLAWRNSLNDILKQREPMDISQVEQVGENVFCGPSSTVLVANDVNVSIFKSAWFGRNQVISEDEMLDDVLISPGIVQIPTRNFQVIIVPNRIQFFLPPQRFDVGQQEIDRVLGTIVRLLPHTPYTAIGLNFEYIVTPPSADTFYEWNRKWFSAPLVEKFPEAKDKTSRFGSYFSMDSLEMRLKIDIKPV